MKILEDGKNENGALNGPQVSALQNQISTSMTTTNTSFSSFLSSHLKEEIFTCLGWWWGGGQIGE